MGFTEDLAAIFTDTMVTVPVEFGTPPIVQETRGITSSEDLPEPDGQGSVVFVKRRRVTIQEGSITGLASNATITVDGIGYTIHGPPRSGGRGRTTLVLAEGP